LTTQTPPGLAFVSGAAYVVSALVVGLLAGALGGRHAPVSTGQTADHLANAVRGLAIGGAIGLLFGLATVRFLSPVVRLLASAVALVVAIGVLVYLQTVPPPVRIAPH
jgi:hypothetical protein